MFQYSVTLLHHRLQCAKAVPSHIDTWRGHVPSSVFAGPHLERRRYASLFETQLDIAFIPVLLLRIHFICHTTLARLVFLVIKWIKTCNVSRHGINCLSHRNENWRQAPRLATKSASDYIAWLLTRSLLQLTGKKKERCWTTREKSGTHAWARNRKSKETQ